ncbi:membrane fusion protein (multidrug efflux system) [Oceanisphaera litoralis]|uniref:efflux RND transporter periplasmic adaptor subunit n=1 Tax=Oceanisphaera litoralis TaxID=225144 RepID=UPI0023BA89D3|nr:efflux RND transporter periplasmic adaptor subunit [Oceanisphaera litoralis]MBM7454791.1 membrane fusion protein (multidrug efflux system) [Oceanisphaera litoralis]
MSLRTFPPRMILVGVLSGLGLMACDSQSAPQAATQNAPLPEVVVTTLQPESVTLTRELPGRTAAYLTAEVRPQVDGIVKQRLFTEGSLVKAGQPLYQLDDASYQAELASARAAQARAEATLTSARLNAARSAELVKIDAVSRQDDENAIATLRQAEADLAAAKAAVRSAQIRVDYARLTAPIDGRTGKSAVTQGALVTANQADALATIQQLDPIYVDLTQSSSELLRLRRELAAGTLSTTDNVPVTIMLEDGTPYEHQGKLAFSEATVDESTGSFLLRVEVPNPDQLLLPGMYLRAQLGQGERDHALLVPQQGIARDPKGNTSALVVNADNQVEQRSVVVSRTLGDQWLLESGLVAGDKVIIEGLQKVRPGAEVRVVEAERTLARQP